MRLVFSVLLTRGFIVALAVLVSTMTYAVPVVMNQSVIQADFNQPTSVVKDTSANLYVLDGANNRVVKIDPTGQSTSFGKKQLSLPMGIAISNNKTLIVADTGNQRLVEFDLNGKLMRSISLHSTPIPNHQFGPPTQKDAWPVEPVAVVVQH
jgi:sugar lactone lactonase YvrE